MLKQQTDSQAWWLPISMWTHICSGLFFPMRTTLWSMMVTSLHCLDGPWFCLVKELGLGIYRWRSVWVYEEEWWFYCANCVLKIDTNAVELIFLHASPLIWKRIIFPILFPYAATIVWGSIFEEAASVESMLPGFGETLGS